MAWLFVLAVALTFAALGFASTVTVLVARDRRRRRLDRTQETAVSIPDPVAPMVVEVSEAADCIQLWLDEQWHQKFGRGVTDRSDTVDG